MTPKEEKDSDQAPGNGEDDGDAMDGDYDSDDRDEDDKNEEKIRELEKKLESDPCPYDTFIALIDVLKVGDDLDKLREMRERFAAIYPLTGQLWLEYINQEAGLACSDEERARIVELYERAVKDYTDPNVWLSYCEFLVDDPKSPENHGDTRAVFERALRACGLNFEAGHKLYEKFRAFEKGLLDKLEQDGVPESAKVEQRTRVRDTFRRQLSVPLPNIDETMKAYVEFIGGEKCDPNTERVFKAAKKKLEDIRPYEEKLSSSNRIEDYYEYIEYELKHKDGARIQSLFERAVTAHCLEEALWRKYFKYLNHVLNIDSVAVEVHARSVRNCSWVGEFWAMYVQCLERLESPAEKILEVINAAMTVGAGEASYFYPIWHAHASYLRRRIDFSSPEESSAEGLREVFKGATEHLSSLEQWASYTSAIVRYWALCEARLGQIAKARELWEKHLLKNGAASDATTWLEFADFEKRFGDDESYRKALKRGLNAVHFEVERVGERWLRYGREEGSLASLVEAEHLVEARMEIINNRKQKRAERDAPEAGPRVKHERTAEPKATKKRKADYKDAKAVSPKKIKKVEKNEFKMPLPVTKPASAPVEAVTKPKENDPLKDAQTVFLSNLAYDIGEERIREAFADIGEIEEVRLVHDFKKRSKGFGYLVFKDLHSVTEALKKDRTPIDGRPVFVTKLNEKKKFDFEAGPAKNKLFIKNLPNDTTKEELETLFAPFGAITDIRFNLQRSGKFKNIAYLDYAEASSAASAVLKMDNFELRDRSLIVAISNPPARNQKSSRDYAPNPAIRNERRPKPQMFVPRSIKRQVDSKEDTEPVAPKSNADFRNLLLK